MNKHTDTQDHLTRLTDATASAVLSLTAIAQTPVARTPKEIMALAKIIKALQQLTDGIKDLKMEQDQGTLDFTEDGEND